jgi:ribonuclease HII
MSATGAKIRRCDPFRFDTQLLAEIDERQGVGDLRLAGADEAGRGCLAGPLVTAAVVLDYAQRPASALVGLTDSKELTTAARQEMYGRILRFARRVSWVACSPHTIDQEGLHRSNLLALQRALEGLQGEYRWALVDGFDLGRADLRAVSLVDADYKSAAVAAASVVAKVVRDRLMRSLAPAHPRYGFEIHVGYGTEAHRQALREYGPCCLHRLSFRGVGLLQLELWESHKEEEPR